MQNFKWSANPEIGLRAISVLLISVTTTDLLTVHYIVSICYRHENMMIWHKKYWTHCRYFYVTRGDMIMCICLYNVQYAFSNFLSLLWTNLCYCWLRQRPYRDRNNQSWTRYEIIVTVNNSMHSLFKLFWITIFKSILVTSKTKENPPNKNKKIRKSHQLFSILLS